MTRQLVLWLEWLVMTIVVLWLIVGLAVTAGPLIAALIVGPALVVYGYGEQRARDRGSSTVWRRSWAAAAVFLAAFLLVGWPAILAALVVGAVVLIRSRRESV